MFYQLPPVGNPIDLQAAEPVSAADALRRVAGDYHPVFTQSGTAALAAAIRALMQQRGVGADDRPQVLIPAYACPDLVSAIDHAGAVPVLVDLQAGRPWMDLQALRDAITADTLAVVTVNLFGIAERIPDIQQCVAGKDITVIEDSAQGFPMTQDSAYWQADLVIISFGRGKPVSLLGGGAVLCRQPDLSDIVAAQLAEAPTTGSPLRFGLQARAYNLLLHPRLYWLLLAMPFLHLGETRYHPLLSIEAMDVVRQTCLAVNIHAYQTSDMRVQQRLAAMLQTLPQSTLQDLPKQCQHPAQRRLLRYPLLLQPAQREQALLALRQHGLGVSVLYPRVLPDIDGLRQRFDKPPQAWPKACAFADSLLTLPTHQGVTEKAILRVQHILAKELEN